MLKIKTLLFVLCLGAMFISGCASEQGFAYWQNGISEPGGVVNELEREVERKHYFYDTDLRGDTRVRYSENQVHHGYYY